MAEQKRINPRYLESYTYEIDRPESNDHFKVLIKIPADLKQADLKIQFNKKKSCVLAGIKDEIPFLCGKCFSVVSDFKYQFQPGLITLTFFKNSDEQWPLIIRDAISSKQNVDPFSALQLSVFLYTSGNPDDGSKLLLYAVSCMYPPAIIQYAKNLLDNGLSADSVVPLLMNCVDEYKFSVAGIVIAQLSLIGQVSHDTAFTFLKKAADLNDPQAKLLLGCFLSPLEEPHGRFENAEEAYKLLSEIQELPNAKFGLARLIHEGIGCQKDEEKALELLESAKKEIPDLPTFEELEKEKMQEKQPKKVENQKTETKKVEKTEKENKQEKKTGVFTKLAIAGTTAVFVAAAGLAVFNRLRKRK
ncbi:hypothetical protein TRFO_00857 [Tritrichomonas foetus]|uniref:CS domain-containing protein n=1 Tax=Tritrichomonas foetus TaxID=1144522 RepID=A0A1J4L3E5_9EUKA|nr:hypothetical protein TRFO_00857 [Tritrichomonas foetus]|eukprot:OHT17600.1 hypothetical protein TRFO_00857 [Tritrichomonas foetus]